MVDRLRGALAGLSSRERVLLMLALACAAGAVLWTLALEPAMQGRTASEARLAERQDLHDWLSERALEARALRATGAREVRRRGTGLAAVEADLTRAGLRRAASYLGPAPDGGVEIRFDAVSYVRLIGWLEETRAASGLRIITATIEPNGAPGQVSARLVARGPTP